MSEKDKQDQLEKYLLGQLPEKERKALEHILSTDEALLQKLGQERDLIAGVEAYGNQELRKELKGIHQEVISKAPAKQPGRRILLHRLVAAAAIGLLLISVYWVFFNTSTNPNDLYATYYQPHPISFASRTGTEDARLLQAAELYKNHRYKAALPIIMTLLKESPNQGELQLAAGISQVELGQSPQAIRHFQQIIQSNDAFFADHARWYLALSHLKNQTLAQARPLLEELANKEGADHQQEAKDLLAKLAGLPD